ncbi:MAG TPA: hypothetical protein VN622_02720 [Clostridia bacterium]|nr:hypothetical protein [Clostridia bacterium]
MNLVRKIATVAALLGLLVLGGCKKKKPPVPSPQTQAPTISAPEPQVQPPPIQPPVTATTTTPSADKPSVTAPAKPSAVKPKPKHRSKKPITATSPKTTTAKNTNKTVADGGSSADNNVQISPEVPRDEMAQQRQDTMKLLDSTELNLRKISGRTLSDLDQGTTRQIRNYITQSRLAVQDGDLERAYNLATKAHLLSDEMVKRQ